MVRQEIRQRKTRHNRLRRISFPSGQIHGAGLKHAGNPPVVHQGEPHQLFDWHYNYILMSELVVLSELPPFLKQETVSLLTSRRRSPGASQAGIRCRVQPRPGKFLVIAVSPSAKRKTRVRGPGSRLLWQRACVGLMGLPVTGKINCERSLSGLLPNPPRTLKFYPASGSITGRYIM
jgi:hypothetical protein